ncbi:MAG: type II toxin-antitoxin system HicA family toxin [Bacteroidetes bacterium]|nr:type II toxin-antitoxin system HicA family toxin [Bacteroidota bacterium]
MSKLPIIDAKNFERLLLQLGFIEIRQKGSHRYYSHPDGRYTTLPHHKGRDLSRPLIRQILKEINLSISEYIELIK